MRAALPAAMAMALWVSAPARAQWGDDDISLDEIATAEREEKAALAKVEAEHGNRPPQELSAEERVQIIHEQQEATREVLERQSLDAKAYATRVARLTPAERAQVDAEKARMDQEEKERQAREAAAPANAGQGELEITRGVDEKHPVDVYRAPGEVEVEHLSEGDEAEEAPAEKPQKGKKPGRGSLAPAPAQKSSRGKKSRHK